MKRITSAWLALALACGACGGELASPPSREPGVEAGPPPPDPYAAECAGAAVPPASLKCTGLYSDVASKVLATGVRAYAPAVPLWADYASKNRWIFLPPGKTIDASNRSEWIFPIGTKVWKEFSRGGKRVETRLFQKVQNGFWVRTTYAWNADDTAATLSGGGDMPWVDGGTYHIPTPDECDQCHRGRTDHLLGFEEVSLGLSGATGLTLAELAAEGLLAPAPPRTTLTVGDDGTGLAAAPLAWLHINCGTTCHNDNANSTAFGSNMRLRLDPSLLDGRSSVDFASRTTTLGMLANTPAWSGRARVVPGDPAHSLLVELITNRGTNNAVGNQMPPIASTEVDPMDTQDVIGWIGKMPREPSDGGAPPDAGRIPDAMVGDATLDDAADATAGEASVDATVDESAVDAGAEGAPDGAPDLEASGDDADDSASAAETAE